MRKFLLAALSAAAFPAFAQDASADFEALAGGGSSESPSADLGTLKWSGDQEFAWRFGAAESPTHTRGSVEGTVAGEYKLGDLKLVAAAAVRNNEYVPSQTAVYYSPGPFKFGLGLQEFSWGVADGNNPTDTLNARDYRYGANAARLVNPAATAAWYPAEWLSLEAVYEPWKKASLFPSDFGAKLRTQFGSYGTVVKVEEDSEDGKNPSYGARANFFLPGADVSVSYSLDRDAYFTPTVTLVNFGSWVPSQIVLAHKNLHRIGLNAKTTVDRFGLWFEGAYTLTEDAASTDPWVRNNKLQWTTGIDFNFGPSGVYYLNLQYAGTYIPGFDSSHPSSADVSGAQATADRYYARVLVDSLGAETEEWMHGATLNLKLPVADGLVTPSLTGAVLVPVGYDAATQTRLASAFFKPEIDVAPADGVHVLLGADLAYGWVKKAGSDAVVLDTTTDKLGTYTSQNSLYVKVQYQWTGGL